ncbi:PHB depolymerase family esterase [Micromonospora sonneratiae]
MLVTATGCSGSDRDTTDPTTAEPTSAEVVGAGDHLLKLSVDGRERTYRLHAPPGFTAGRPVPVVIGLHFYPANGSALQEMIGLDELADQHGFLTVYPDGVNGGYNALTCCGEEDDVGFVRALVDRLRSRWAADPQRLYLTGISNGGDMAFRLAVELPDTFAAIAPVSGGFIGERTSDANYRPKSPVSVLTFIGGQDRYAAQFDAGITRWQERLGCQPGRPSTAGQPGPITRTATTCPDGSQVVVFRLPRMGHNWPGATQGRLAAPDAGIVATELMWEFFAGQQRRSA